MLKWYSIDTRLHQSYRLNIPKSGFPQHSWCQAHSAGLPEGQHLSAWALQTPVNTESITLHTALEKCVGDINKIGPTKSPNEHV